MDFKFALALLVLLFHCTHSLPQSEDFIIPSPAEINNFYQDPTYVNERRDVAPLNQFHPTATLEETVKEVEDMIKTNPKLPRLTRGEIIDILENITGADILEAQNSTRADGQRAIMVVMPFTAGSAQGDIKELYTRAPVTHIIGGDIPKVEFKPKKKPSRRKPPSFPKIQIEEDDDESNLIQQKVSNINTFNIPSTTTENTPTSIVTSTQKTVSSSFSIPVTTNDVYDFTTYKTVFEDVPIPVRFHQKYVNHKYPDEDLTTFAPESGIHIISPPTLVNYDNEYFKPYTIKLEDLKTRPNPPETLSQKLFQTTPRTVIDDIIVPDNFKLVADDIEVLHKPNFNKINMVLPKQTTETIFLPMSFLTTSSTTMKPIPGVSIVADNLSPDMKDLLQNFGLLENHNAKPEIELPTDSDVFVKNAEIKPESYLSFKPLPDDTSSRQEMDDFLAKFGLGRNSARSQKSIAMSNQVKEFEKNPHINFDVVPPSYHGVMQDLGFTTRNVKTMQSDNQITNSPKHVFNPTTTQNNTEEEMGRLTKLLNIIRDLDKKNINITEENLKNMDVNVLKDLIDSFNTDTFVPLDEKEGPNPLNYDYKIIKNDFKRQENTTTTSTTTTSTEAARNPSLEDLEASFGGLPETETTTTEPPSTTKRSGFYYLVDWNTFLDLDDENGRRVNLRFQPKVGDPRNFRYVTVP